MGNEVRSQSANMLVEVFLVECLGKQALQQHWKRLCSVLWSSKHYNIVFNTQIRQIVLLTVYSLNFYSQDSAFEKKTKNPNPSSRNGWPWREIEIYHCSNMKSVLMLAVYRAYFPHDRISSTVISL